MSDAQRPRRGRILRLAALVPPVLLIYAPVALCLTVLFLVGRSGWTSGPARADPVYGVNFSCKRTDHLGLACGPTLERILNDLGVRHIRISAYWSDIEQEPGRYDFSSVDRLLDMADRYGARVTVSIGMRAQRFPEFWFPTWLRLALDIGPGEYPEDQPLVRAALIPYLEAAAGHIGAHPAVEAIQVENEPFVPSYAYATRWRIRPEFLAEEIAIVRANDPGGHPIVVSHASWDVRDETWRWIVEHADAIAQSTYTKRQYGPWRWMYLFPYRIGPLTPDLPRQAREAAARGKQLWIGELQAEPFEDPAVDIRQIETSRAASFSPRWLRENLRFAERSGAQRAYLWGVEWWLYLAEHRNEPELWDAGRVLFRAQQPAAPLPQAR